MSGQRPMAADHGVAEHTLLEDAAAERRLRNLRYVIASVDADALRAWSMLWQELATLDSEGGAVSSPPEGGFQPPSGWPKFLERFWTLKHYLDRIHHLCR
jgi:hypothetical protein